MPKIKSELNFNVIGCEVGKDSLDLRMKLAQKKKDEDNELQKKKHARWIQQKQKFEKIVNENIPLEKLSIGQLRVLCTFKKLKTDRVYISKLKRSELLPLWLSWKDRPEVHEDVPVEEAATIMPSVPVPVPAYDVCNGSDTGGTNHDSVMNDHQTESDDIMNVMIV